MYLVKKLLKYNYSNNILHFPLLMYVFAIVWDVFKRENSILFPRGRNCQRKELLTKDLAPASAITIMFSNVLTFNLCWQRRGEKKPLSESLLCITLQKSTCSWKKMILIRWIVFFWDWDYLTPLIQIERASYWLPSKLYKHFTLCALPLLHCLAKVSFFFFLLYWRIYN